MKKIIYSIFSLALMATGMTSCSNEDMPIEKGSNLTREVYFEADVTREDDFTRVDKSVTENGIVNQWQEGDRLLITDDKGERLGQLTYGLSKDGEKYIFSGTILTSEEDGTYPINLYYLGSENNLNTAITEQNFEINISSQKGTEKGLADYDFMSCTSTMEVIGGKASGRYKLNSTLSFAVYRLDFGNAVSSLANSKLEITGENIYTGATVNLSNAEIGSYIPETGNSVIKITDIKEAVVNGNVVTDVYVAYLAHENIKLTFNMTVGDELFTATLPVRTYNPNRLFIAYNGKNESVQMYKSAVWTLTYDANAEGVTNMPEPSVVESEANFNATHEFTVSSTVPVREGYKFLGWADTKDGEKAYEGGNTIKLTRPETSKTIYAVWEEEWHFNTYTLYLGENGKYGQIDQNYPKVKTPWEFYYTENWDEPNLEGYTFLGWADSKDATTPDYTLSGKTLITTGGKDVQTKTVYPVWKKNVTSGNITTPGSTGTDY